MNTLTCKLLVLGAGPGGYVCAIRAGQLGIDTIVVEQAMLGGTCLNVGCIPSKAIIHAAEAFHNALHTSSQRNIGLSTGTPALNFQQTLDWKDSIVNRLNTGVSGLLKKAKVNHVQGNARFHDGKKIIVDTPEGETAIVAENVVIATGSTSVELPNIPFDGRFIQSSSDVLADPELPHELVVVGGGYIGLELGTAMAKLGVSVTVIEATNRVLSQYDAELTQPVTERLHALGIQVLTDTCLERVGEDKKSVVIKTNDGKLDSIPASKVLVTVGRRPVTESLALDRLALTKNGSFIAINEQCATSMRGIYAIGDVTGEPMLAHRAIAQGELVAEIVAGQKRHWDKYAIPSVCFTDPELVVVGLSPDEATDAGYETLVNKFPFAANGRSMTQEREDGFIRIVARADNHQILGIQGVGEGIAELSASFVLAIEMGATLEDIAATIQAHPTRAEALQEAAFMSLGHALHI